MTSKTRLMRCKLFVPGSRPEFFTKAMQSAADALSFDLEDAVVTERKAEARTRVAEFLTGLGPSAAKIMIVRVNGLDTADFMPDLEAVAVPALDAINLPKGESGADVERAAMALDAIEARKGLTPGRVKILVNIESPKGWRLAHELATASPRVMGLQLGLGDLFAPHGITRTESTMAAVRLAMKMAAAEARVPAYDTANANVADKAGLEADARAGRLMGYAGKSAIHPSQIEIINRVYTPSEAEIAHARDVLTALADPVNRGKGAFIVNGKMVDGPFFDEARAIVELADRIKHGTV
ncbi:MAG: CoA ester lyase [Hyphomicrobiaceae bacterium]